jgi:hypothetical protein
MKDEPRYGPNRLGVVKAAEGSKYDGAEYSREGGCARPGRRNRIRLMPHQRLISDFMSAASPIRGLLLYHGLGTGKSCSAIVAAEAAAADGERQIAVLLPAALESNFVGEVWKCGRDLGQTSRWEFVKVEKISTTATFPVSKRLVRRFGGFWQAVPGGAANIGELGDEQRTQVEQQVEEGMRAAYDIYHYNGWTAGDVTRLLQKLATHRTVVIVDEVHNFVSRAIGAPRSLTGQVYTALCDAQRCRVICLSGTPIVNYPRELAYLVNLVKGADEVFRVPFALAGKRELDMLKVKLELDAVDRIDFVVQVNFAQGFVSFKLMPDGFVRRNGAAIPWSRPVVTDTVLRQVAERMSALGAKCDLEQVSREYRYPLPNNEADFYKTYVDMEAMKLRNVPSLERRLLAFASHFSYDDRTLYPLKASDTVVSCPMSAHQFDEYSKARVKEIERETAAARRRAVNPLDQGGQVYKAFSRIACNFVFPAGIRRPFKSMEDEESAGTGEKVDVDKAVAAAIASVVSSGDRYLRKELGVHSPKYAAILEKMEASPGPVVVYSQFRRVEGLNLFAHTLRANGYSEMTVSGGVDASKAVLATGDPKRPHFIMFMGDNNRSSSEMLKDVFNSETGVLPPALLQQLLTFASASNVKQAEMNKRGRLVKAILISQSGAEGISLRNVRQVHIMEPYWNDVRGSQVIGRAIRTCSHHDLPPADRKVDVFRYAATIPSNLLQPGSKIGSKDGGRSADELVMATALNKASIVAEILALIRSTAVDCRAHEALHPGVVCFRTVKGSDSDLAYEGDMLYEEDTNVRTDAGAQQAVKVLVLQQPYLMLLASKELYNWRMWRAGVLKYVGVLRETEWRGRKGFVIERPAA